MADFNAQFTAADQTLAFALTWFATERVTSRADQDMWLAVMNDVLPFVSEDHPIVEPMVAAASGLIRTIEGGDRLFGWAHYDASQAVAKFASWRAARAYEVVQAQRQGGDGGVVQLHAGGA